MTGAVAADSGRDRRAEPRVPLGVAVTLRTAGSAVIGRTVDVSLGGVQVELLGPLPASLREVVLEFEPGGERDLLMRAAVVRRALTAAGRSLVALRLLPGRAPSGYYTGPALAARAPVARAAEGSRESDLAQRQLKAIAARVLEMALEDGAGSPPDALVGWVGRLAAELGVDAPADVSTNRALFRGIADMHRGRLTRSAAGTASAAG